MNGSEDSSQLGLVRPEDQENLSYSQQQLHWQRYIKWLRAAYEFNRDIVEAELKRYTDKDGWGEGTTPEVFGGRGDYLNVCEYCGKQRS